MPITALYAGVLALLYLALSVRVISVRRARKVEIGNGEDRELLRRIRVHANFAEYAPYALILMGVAEQTGGSVIVLHGAGLLLLAGRLSHAYGLSQTPHILPLRVGGMALTFTAIVILALLCLSLSLPRLLP